MGHFTIELPDNKKADVRYSSVVKMEISHTYNLETSEKISESEQENSVVAFHYTVTISIDGKNNEYSLFKTVNGQWFKDYEGKIQLDDGFLMLLKNAVIKRETELNNR